MTQDMRSSVEVDEFEAALEFISRYELSDDEGGVKMASGEVDLTESFHRQNLPSIAICDDELPSTLLISDAFDSPLRGAISPANAISTELPAALSPISSDRHALPVNKRGKQRRPVSRRQELDDLRETVKHLSDKLESLRSSSSPSATSSVSSTGSPTTEETQYVCSLIGQPESVWENLAARQLAARKRAEVENEQLKAIVDHHVRQTRNLKRRVRRQAKTGEVGRILGAKRFKSLSSREMASIFGELQRDMDELYVSIDKQFAAADMASLPCPGRKRQVRRTTVSGIFIELMDCNPVPFPLHRAEKAVWVSFGERGLRYRTEFPLDFKALEITESAVMASYTFVVSGFNVNSAVRCHRVAHKYVEEDRTVVVCQTVTEPVLLDDPDSLGLKFFETLLLIVKAGDDPDTSVIQSHITITRLDSGREPARRFRSDAYIDIAVSGWNQSKTRDNQLIENVLMEELVTGQVHSGVM